jgi:GNAT superfamily N-acetyltransferase
VTVTRPAEEADLDAMLPLFAGYQRFYGAVPDDDRNRAFFRRFVAPSEHGLLLVATDDDGEPVGFACLYWTFSSTRAAEVALMNDLFVSPDRRGGRIGQRLIEAAATAARDRGMHRLEWFTAPDNVTAQRLYDRTGAWRSEWICYELPTA